jgi:small GTP-binding protein
MAVPGRTTPEKWVKAKVCLVGEQSVGKTSLIRRFVTGRFSETYISTLGATESKKTIRLSVPPGIQVRLDMMIVDIMGDRSFISLVKQAYFKGSSGVLGVFDLTRPVTSAAIPTWIEHVRSVAGNIPAVIVGNKVDLVPADHAADNEVARSLVATASEYLVSSAKTGEGVEEAFQRLAAVVVSSLLQHA